jgi:hypothetical protein
MIKHKGSIEPIHFGDARSVIIDPIGLLYPEGQSEEL